MNKRKSPIRHKVKPYTRNGVKVNGYFRGSGTATRSRSKKKVSMVNDNTPHPDGPKGWVITFIYEDGLTEAVTVISDNQQDALDEAYEEREHKTLFPVDTIIHDPPLEEVVARILSGAKKVTKTIGSAAAKGAKATGRVAIKGVKLAGKTTVDAAKAAGRGAKFVVGEAIDVGGTYYADKKQEIKFNMEMEKAAALLRQAYGDPDDLRVKAARFALKKHYRELYDSADFSREYY